MIEGSEQRHAVLIRHRADKSKNLDFFLLFHLYYDFTSLTYKYHLQYMKKPSYNTLTFFTCLLTMYDNYRYLLVILVIN